MKIGFAVFGVLLLVLVGATVLLSLLPDQDAPAGLGETSLLTTTLRLHTRYLC